MVPAATITSRVERRRGKPSVKATVDGDRTTFELWQYHGDVWTSNTSGGGRSSLLHRVEELHEVPFALVLQAEQLHVLVELSLAIQTAHQSTRPQQQFDSSPVGIVVRLVYKRFDPLLVDCEGVFGMLLFPPGGEI